MQLEASCAGTEKANLRAMERGVENRESNLENNLGTAEAVDTGRTKEGGSVRGKG